MLVDWDTGPALQNQPVSLPMHQFTDLPIYPSGKALSRAIASAIFFVSVPMLMRM